MNRICVLGLGYIGLPTASILATHSFDVVGVDVNPQVIEAISESNGHIEEPGLGDLVQAVVESGSLKVSIRPEEADAFIIAVSTPLIQDKRADLSYVELATRSILPVLRKDNLVILESTVPPGTTRDFVKPILEESGLVAGEDFFLTHCPERVLPGQILKEIVQNNRIIGGINPQSAERAKVERFEELKVWQAARDLVNAIYQASSYGAFSRDYALRDQIRRAVVAIPSNIVRPVKYMKSALFHGARVSPDTRTKNSSSFCSSFTPWNRHR